MPQIIDAIRYEQLRQAVEAGDRDSYYRLLSSWGYRYGTLAGQVVNDNFLSGSAANAFAAQVYRELNGRELEESTWLAISIELMEADFERRNVGQDLELPNEVIERYHGGVFQRYGLPLEAWTAYAPLRLAADRDAIWDRMLDTDGSIGQILMSAGIWSDVASNNPLFVWSLAGAQTLRTNALIGAVVPPDLSTNDLFEIFGEAAYGAAIRIRGEGETSTERIARVWIDAVMIAPDNRLTLDEWDSGERVWLVDLIAPFATNQNRQREIMIADLISGPLKGVEFRFHQTDPQTGKRNVQTVTANAGEKFKAAIEAATATTQ